MRVVFVAFKTRIAVGKGITRNANPMWSGKPYLSSLIAIEWLIINCVQRLMQDITNATPGICDNSIKQKQIKANWGQSIHLSCPIHIPDIESIIASEGPIKWFYYRSERSSGYEVFPRRDKFVHTSEHGLVILGISDRENGRYECKLGTNTLFSYSIQVDASKRSLLSSNLSIS